MKTGRLILPAWWILYIRFLGIFNVWRRVSGEEIPAYKLSAFSTFLVLSIIYYQATKAHNVCKETDNYLASQAYSCIKELIKKNYQRKTFLVVFNGFKVWSIVKNLTTGTCSSYSHIGDLSVQMNVSRTLKVTTLSKHIHCMLCYSYSTFSQFCFINVQFNIIFIIICFMYLKFQMHYNLHLYPCLSCTPFIQCMVSIEVTGTQK